MTDINRKW